MSNLQNIIETAFEARADINHNTVSKEVRDAVEQTIADIDNGKIRVAEKKENDCSAKLENR